MKLRAPRTSRPPAAIGTLAETVPHGRAKQAPPRHLHGVLALRRAIGNHATARVLARALPDSTEEWREQLVPKAAIEPKGKGEELSSASGSSGGPQHALDDPHHWAAVLGDADPTRKYAVEDGAVRVNELITLHPRKLAELLEDGLLTRVLMRIPAPGTDLASNAGARFIVSEYGLKFDADFAAHGKDDLTASMITSTHRAPAKAQAVAYVQWLVVHRAKLIPTQTTPQKINHAQFYLETAAVPAKGDEGVFATVADRYAELGIAKVVADADHLPAKPMAPIDETIAHVRENASDLRFASTSAALYHAAKHWRDVFSKEAPKRKLDKHPLREGLAPRDVDDYVNHARRVVALGVARPGSRDQRSTGYRIEFEHEGITAIVAIRADGWAVIASAHPRTAESEADASPGSGQLAKTKVLPIVADEKTSEALRTKLVSALKQGPFDDVLPDSSTDTVELMDATTLKFTVDGGVEHEIAVTLGSTTALTKRDPRGADVTLRITAIEGTDPTKEITASLVVAMLTPLLAGYFSGVEPTSLETVRELQALKATSEQVWADTAKLKNLKDPKAKEAIDKRDEFQAALDKHVRSVPGGAKSLLDDVQSAGLEDAELGELDPILRQLTAFHEQEEFLKARPKTDIPTAVTPELIEHLLFADAGGGGISGGHLDQNLHRFLRANPRYHAVERLNVKYGTVTLRLYDQFYWDEKNNDGAEPPPLDEPARRPSAHRDLARYWTRASTPKTTVDSIAFYLHHGEQAFLHEALSDKEFLHRRSTAFGATTKGATSSKASSADVVEYAGHVGYRPDDSPFLKTLYLSVDWLTRHSGTHIEASPPSIPEKTT